MRDALPAAERAAPLSALVIGVGSPFGDDRIGWEVVAALETWLQDAVELPCQIRTLACDRPGAGLVELLGGAQHVVIVDAARWPGALPGTIRWLASEDLDAGVSRSSHGFGVAEALALAVALGHAPSRLELLAIAGDRFDTGELSAPTRAAVPRAVALIIERLLGTDAAARV